MDGVLCDRILAPIEACLWDALSSLKVYVDQAKALLLAVGPLEVVDERPAEVAAEGNPGVDDSRDLCEVAAEVRDALVVLHATFAVDGIRIRSTVSAERVEEGAVQKAIELPGGELVMVARSSRAGTGRVVACVPGIS